MRIRAAVLTTGLLLVPVMGWAQAPEERIDQALDRAEATGIPSFLLENKIAEGRAKGVPADRLADAVERRLSALDHAREVMGRGAGDLDGTQLAVGADALASGVSEEVLAEIAATTPRERRAVAVAALAHLVEQEVVPEEALAQVQAALGREAPGLGGLPGVAGPPSGLLIPGMGGPPSGVGPGERGPPERPGQGGPPGGGGGGAGG